VTNKAFCIIISFDLALLLNKKEESKMLNFKNILGLFTLAVMVLAPFKSFAFSKFDSLSFQKPTECTGEEEEDEEDSRFI
jgi:hypothetical protein